MRFLKQKENEIGNNPKNKKVISLVVILIVVALVGGGIVIYNESKNKAKEVADTDEISTTSDNVVKDEGKEVKDKVEVVVNQETPAQTIVESTNPQEPKQETTKPAPPPKQEEVKPKPVPPKPAYDGIKFAQTASSKLFSLINSTRVSKGIPQLKLGEGVNLVAPFGGYTKIDCYPDPNVAAEVIFKQLEPSGILGEPTITNVTIDVYPDETNTVNRFDVFFYIN